MNNLLLLNERLSELNSGIIKININKIYLTGFLSPERLLDYYNENKQCFCSKGIYEINNFTISDIDLFSLKSNSLFYVLNEKNELIDKIEFNVLKRDTINHKINKKHSSITFEIKKCIHSNEGTEKVLFGIKDLKIVEIQFLGLLCYT